MKLTKSELFGVAIGALIAAGPAAAQTQINNYQIEEQSLGEALRAVGRQSGREVMFSSELVEGKRSPRLDGSYTADEAVDRLLAQSGLVAVRRNGSIFIRGRSVTAQAAVSDSQASERGIVVTGSRIRGAPSTSPVMSIGRVEAQRSGQTDLGQLIRDLPQNFAGGQNPTNAGAGQGGFTNISGSSTLNLRGLGPDASLTLVNGHRIPFDAITQGIDISAIPLDAIERIEVVADGASALYGSDAVGGVANVILRRSVEGLSTSARLGAATDGGAVMQQYDIVAGPSWSSGSFMAAANYQHATEIAAGQRSYSANMAPTATLIPAQKQLSLIVAGRQDIGKALHLEMDGHFTHRATSRCIAVLVSASCYGQGNVISSTVDSWSVSPSLHLDIAHGWNLRLSGTYGESNTSVATRLYSVGTQTALVTPVYSNDLKAIELGAEGPLFTLPGGVARLAVGIGYRSSGLHVDSRRFAGGTQTILANLRETRNVGFGYGELFLPFISPENTVELVSKLQLVGALRYEDHRNIDQVTTPKIGLIYAPTNGVEFKASWGTSFKVPTLYQTGQPTDAQLLRSSLFTPTPASGFPLLYLFGGNRNLSPERATTWTVSSTITPAFLEGLRAELSYFQIRYRDRVTAPVLAVTNAFQPIYSDFVQLNPSGEDVLAAIDGINGAFTNLTAGAFNPGQVSAIFRNNVQNVAFQFLEGVDGSVSYLQDFGDNGRLSIKGSASYLVSKRTITDRLPTVAQAGVIFTPPHWRGRISGNWDHGSVNIAIVGNYIGPTKDDRQATVATVGSFTTADAAVTIRSGAANGAFANIDWTVAIQNLSNKKPSYVFSADPAAMRFDSTNQSVYGRVVNFTLSKVW